MIRIVIENLLLLLLPTLLYLAYIYLTAKSATTRRGAVNDAPFVWLFLTGVALVVTVVLVFGTLGSGRPGEAYKPPEFRDGKIVPGEVQKRPPPADG